MDRFAEKQLEEEVAQTVQMILLDGDQDYIRSLSNSELIKALEIELKFMGFYSYDDHETPEIIHAILEENLPHWSYMMKMNDQLK